MINGDDNLIADFAQNVAPNVSPLEGNSIENDEKVSYAIVNATNLPSQIESVDWSSSIIERCRFANSTISDSSFERTGIIDCDMSGVTFVNCLLRGCIITGVKAGSYLAFDNCILDQLFIARSRIDSLEFQQCHLTSVEFFTIESEQFGFRQCKAHKRKARVLFQECEISKVSGLESMGNNGISLHVDAPMWRDLGDYYLKQHGIQQLESAGDKSYGLLDDIGESIQRIS